jgi:hypothetical protein
VVARRVAPVCSAFGAAGSAHIVPNWQDSREQSGQHGVEDLIQELKVVTERPFADPEAAARQLVQLASSIEAVQDGRVHIEKINYPFL